MDDPHSKHWRVYIHFTTNYESRCPSYAGSNHIVNPRIYFHANQLKPPQGYPRADFYSHRRGGAQRALALRLRAADVVDGGIDQLVAPSAQSRDGRRQPDVGNDPHALGRTLVRVEDAQAADVRVQAAGDQHGGHVAVGARGSAADYDGSGYRTEGHGMKFGAALRGLVDQNHHLAVIVRRGRRELHYLPPVKRARIGDIAMRKPREGCRLRDQHAAQNVDGKVRRVIAYIDDEPSGPGGGQNVARAVDLFHGADLDVCHVRRDHLERWAGKIVD